MWLSLRISDAFVVHFRLKLLANSSYVISYILGDDRSAILCPSPAFQLQLFSCHGRKFSTRLIKADLNFTYRWLVWLVPLEAKCFASIVYLRECIEFCSNVLAVMQKKMKELFSGAFLAFCLALEQLSRKGRGILRFEITFTILIQFLISFIFK